MEQTIVSSFFWFSIGAVFYAVFSRLLAIGQSLKIFEMLETSVFVLLQETDKEVQVANEIKYKALLASGAATEVIEKVKQFDVETLQLWRQTTLLFILASIPRSFHKYIDYSKWGNLSKLKSKEVNSGD